MANYQITRLQNYKMSRFAEPMTRLIDELKKLPGIGSKSAQRLAFHILRSSEDDAEALASAVRDVKAKLRLCSICNNITDVDPCVYCSSPTRNQKLVCVVEEPTNIAAVEKTRHFNGVYHVLHGSISPLHGVGPEQLRISNLISRVGRGEIEEVILATNPTVEGEATATYLAQQLKRQGLRVTRIAMGIPVGSDIEYTDEVTMLKAMEGRRKCKFGSSPNSAVVYSFQSSPLSGSGPICETVNHQGHEGTRRKRLRPKAFVILRVLGCPFCGLHQETNPLPDEPFA